MNAFWNNARPNLKRWFANESLLPWSLMIVGGGILVASSNLWARVAAAICVLVAFQRFSSGRRLRRAHTVTTTITPSAPAESPASAAAHKPADRSRLRSASTTAVPPTTSAAFVREMIFQGRYAVLLRPEVAKNLSHEQRDDVLRAFHEEMSLIKTARPPKSGQEGREPAPEPIFIDRYAVSNMEFQEFVNAGGYEMPEVWAEEVRESLEYFVDQTGSAGPRYWRDSNYTAGTAHLPVVGISWFEADAYARWVGKRLPGSPEWVRAAAGSAPSPAAATQALRFPWGNMFHEDRANLWVSGRGQPVPVEEYPLGQTSTGVRQLIGNTWEWMSDDLAGNLGRGELKGPSALMKTIHGGAFNTYFESQATCQSASGDHPSARRDNIGFRCAFDASEADANLLDLSLSA